MKKFLPMRLLQFIPALFLLSVIPANADQYGDFIYTANATEVTISGYTGAGGALTIPSSIDGLPVKNIGSAFNSNTSLSSVTIPNSVTSIGEEAFYYCTGLTSVVVDEANPNYSSVAGVLFNKSQTTLIQYPGGKIGGYTIPSSVTSIGNWAFNYCSGLTSVTIPSSVTSIGSFAFYWCSGLTSMVIPDRVTTIEQATFLGCYRLTSVTIPNSVTRIGGYAFTYCNPTSVTIPNSMTSIGSYAFSECGLTSVNIPNSVTSIEGFAFSRCGLTSVTIPNSVTSIEDNAFEGCWRLTSVTIPNSITRIGVGLFQYCQGLTRITIPSSVTSIGRGAFNNCTNLARVYFNGNAPNTDGPVFDNASPSIYYYAETTGWGLSFDGLPTAEALTFVTQPANVGCNQGRRATFSVSTTGVEVAYQWKKDGVDIPNATKATFTLTNVQALDIGNYTVVARNLEGSFTSAHASLVVYPDADSDGLTDADEVTYDSNVNQGDTDGDGISDGDEVHRYLSNPTLKDTDGDGYEDGFEIGVGYSPTSVTSTPQAVSLIHPAVEFEFSADLGVAYEIQQSLDLQNWTTIETSIIGQGRVETRFYSTQNQPKRYFRVNRY